ncbi:hypothetical protein E6C76_17260 [Pseudothauera nasutitermitis]|uniref:Phosphate ABC transporter substrate-binding protein n=1 Tax=Pseudothauera nasutitermitis TaxID=2565930 RepID=A0A4S4AT13_9RHOO|nr:hypothetical protein [Pseudothauera nasutitermitis]THF63007.1 hypothetical protein E6C76_17260 [Pseudothauera nasutitermitis]
MPRPLHPLLAACALLLWVAGVRAEFVLIGHADNPLPALSREQAEQLYLGRRDALPDGRTAMLVDLPPGNLRDRFYLLLTGKNPAQIRAWWSRQVFSGRALPPREAGSVSEARQWVAANPAAIGYLPADAATDGLKILLRLP